MKKGHVFIVLLAMLFLHGSGASQAISDDGIPGDTWSGMPPRPIPENPIPHHDVGKPSKAAQFTTQAIGIDAQGVEQAYTLTGLDALLADGIIDDPFAGNYRLVELDKIMFGAFAYGNTFAVQTFDITPTLEIIPNSGYSLGNYWNNDIAAGDLNEDDQLEQLAAWVDGIGKVYLSISEIPSQPAKTTSAPAALAQGDGTGDLLVRGYDDAMWHSHYDGVAWGPWVNAGGTLLSAPAIVSLGSGQFDAYAIGTDNLTYRQHWEGGVFSGTWELVDIDEDWDPVQWVSPIPEVDAPAVVAHTGGELDIFRRGSDNTLRWRHFDGSDWGDWSSLGGFLSSAPSAVLLDGGAVQVFGRGLDGSIWHRTGVGDSWGIWQRLGLPQGITAASAPTAVSSQAGQINLYLRGSDDALWQNQYSGGAWGDWISSGGELGSRVAAAVWSDHAELFAQKVNDRLQHSSDGLSWSDFQTLPVQRIFDTGAQAMAPGVPWLDNYWIDIETGYFTGERSQQIAIAYVSAIGQYKLELWDVRDGFTPYKLAELETPISSYSSRIVVADVNGDGVDDIAVVNLLAGNNYQVSIYHTQVQDGQWSLVPGVSSDLIYGGDHPFGGTLRLAAGDLNGDLDDEIVVLSDWVLRHEDLDWVYILGVQLYLFDVDDPATAPAKVWGGYTEDDVFIEDTWATGLGLAVGDINADAIDEIVLTWPTGFDGDDWPDLYRELQVLDASNYDPEDPDSLVLLANYPFAYYQRFSFLDALAVGDLDRDFVDEIVFYQSWYPYEQLSAYEYEDASIEIIANKDWGGTGNQYVKLVTGDYTGESLRVGSPTFRSQDHTGGITAIINMPPKHIDTLDGVTYDVNSTDQETYASYENERKQGTSMSLQAQRSWSFASGTEWGIGDPEGTHVGGSINTTYGENFTRTNTAFSQINFGENLQATNDDFVIYTDQSLDVWEYPAFDDDSGVPKSLIMVVFPKAGLNNYGAEETIESGNSTCDFWYAPEHQINNVWSYSASIDQLKDFNGQILNLGTTYTVGADDRDQRTSWSDVDEESQSSSCTLSVDSMFEWQVGGDTFEVSAEPFGVGVAYEVHLPYLKDTTHKNYTQSTLSSRKVFGSEETTVSVHFDTIDPSGQYNYQVTPYLYWAKNGYLVLDYLTNPLNQGFWLKYDKPDPAFILPWAGGLCTGKELFSKDIQISPPFAYYGETVNITATVHNFSDFPVDDVRVRFFLGEPEDGYQIGNDQIVNLPGRAKVDVSVDWEATGMTQQRIYVVIDPDHAITEMHDETTNPENDNNMGFGVAALGNSGYLDPGGKTYFDYQHLTYTDTQNLPASFYFPTAAMTKTLHLEMTPLVSGWVVRHGFRLDAYMGGSNRIPWNVDFQEMPAAVWVYYSESDIAGLDEGTLILYRYNKDEEIWEDAACGEYQRYPDGNTMIVPVCKTGAFAILSPYSAVFLPIVAK